MSTQQLTATENTGFNVMNSDNKPAETETHAAQPAADIFMPDKCSDTIRHPSAKQLNNDGHAKMYDIHRYLIS